MNRSRIGIVFVLSILLCLTDSTGVQTRDKESATPTILISFDGAQPQVIEKLITIKEMIFVGDALFPDGNDYSAREAGVVSIQVRDPDEMKRVIEAIVACLDCVQRARPSEANG